MSESSPAENLVDLYDNAPCGYLSLSPDEKIVKINRTLLDWLGMSDADLLGQSVHAILSFGSKIAFETHLAPLLRLQGFVHEIALDIVAAGGEKIPVIANAAERRGPEGQHHFTRLTVFKAVDRRTFERSLIEARLKAEETAKTERKAIELREQLMAVLGHDLRNPLAAIGAGLHILSRRGGLEPRTEDVIRAMEGSLNRANALINDLLDFARGRLGGGIAITRDAARPLQPVLEQVVTEMRAISPEAQFDVAFDLALPVDCDPDRMGQMASNLLANAVTHGSLDRPIRFTARAGEDTFEMSVSNAGTPIPDAARESLFQPFFRGEFRSSRNGLGLGLFIVSEIAKAHRGQMSVESNADETSFRFRMPRTVAGKSDPGGGAPA